MKNSATMKTVATITAVLVLVVTGLAACQPDDETPLALRARFSLDAAAVEFGARAIGQRSAIALEVANRGQVGLWLQVAIEGALAPVFSIDADSFFLDVGSQRRLLLTFAPDRLEDFAATLRLFDRADPLAEVVVAVTGHGDLPDCDDANPCTDDWFDLAGSVCRNEVRAGDCDDGLRCTDGDRCVAGVCLGVPVACRDAVDCTIDACDEQQGCVAIPDAGRCNATDVCTVGRCDAAAGCQISAAVDGSPCGDFSCAEMHICLAGLCRNAPAPDGMPCDDGDMCTAEDSCRAGVCQPGSGLAFGVSQPIDFLFGYALANAGVAYYPYGDPTAVLSIHAPAAGGLEVIWAFTPYWQDVSVEILRTRLDSNGVVFSSETLFVAEQTRAAYDGDDLLMLISGCRGCCQGDLGCADPSTVEPCSLILRRYPADGATYVDVCLGGVAGYDYYGLSALDVADGTSQIALTSARLTDDELPGASVMVQSVDRAGQVSPLRQVYGWNDPISSYVPNARQLRLTIVDQRPLLALSHVEEFTTSGCGCSCCATCDCDADTPCTNWDFGGVLLDPGSGGISIGRELHLGVTTRGLGLSPGLGLTGWLWRERYNEDDLLQACQPVDEVVLFTDQGVAGVQQSTVLREVAGSISAVTATALAGQPAMLLQRGAGQLAFYSVATDGTVESMIVPTPMAIYSQMARSFTAAALYYPLDAPTAVTAEIPGGLVVAALTRPYTGSDSSAGAPASEQDAIAPPNSTYGIAFFTVGCGATIPPRQ